MTSTTAIVLMPGETVGAYRIVKVIGIGGMAIVYEAEHIALGRPVALKVLSPRLSRDEAFRERFRREGRHIAALEHPNVVTVYDSGESEGQLYLAMRFVSGTTLGERIADQPLTAADTIRILRPIAEALDAAHAAGLVHRDVKPQNILLGADDHPYLADFGVAKASHAGGLTATGGFVGSFNYAAPEQFTGRSASPATDVYSLTAVLFECFTGQVPYPRDTDAGVLNAHVTEPPPRVELTGHGAVEFNALVERGMAKHPGARPPRASELLRLAEEVAERIPSDQLTVAPPFSAFTSRPAESEADPPASMREEDRVAPTADASGPSSASDVSRDLAQTDSPSAPDETYILDPALDGNRSASEPTQADRQRDAVTPRPPTTRRWRRLRRRQSAEEADAHASSDASEQLDGGEEGPQAQASGVAPNAVDTSAIRAVPTSVDEDAELPVAREDVARHDEFTAADSRRPAPERAAAPQRRRRHGRLLVLLASVVLAGGVIAAGMALLTGSPAVAASKTITSGPIRLRYAAPWHRSSAAALGASVLRSPVTLSSPGGQLAAGPIKQSARIPAGAPPELTAKYGSPQTTSTVKAGRLNGVRYVWHLDGGRVLSALVLPTGSGDLALICDQPAASLRQPRSCASLADSATVTGSDMLAPGPDVALASAISNDLGSASGVAGKAKRLRGSFAARSSGAAALETLDARGARRVAAQSTPSRYATDVHALSNALSAEASAFHETDRAAKAGSRNQYRTARAAVEHASDRVVSAARALREDGLPVGNFQRLIIPEPPVPPAPRKPIVSSQTTSPVAAAPVTTPAPQYVPPAQESSSGSSTDQARTTPSSGGSSTPSSTSTGGNGTNSHKGGTTGGGGSSATSPSTHRTSTPPSAQKGGTTAGGGSSSGSLGSG